MRLVSLHKSTEKIHQLTTRIKTLLGGRQHHENEYDNFISGLESNGWEDSEEVHVVL
jgi:hypothetical protein